MVVKQISIFVENKEGRIKKAIGVSAVRFHLKPPFIC